MSTAAKNFAQFSSTTWADVLERKQIMDFGIRPLWAGTPRIAGPAYPVACAPGDNLMLHAAIYRAPRGAVVVCQAGDLDYAVAGGNVCATAQKNGIAGFVIDGLVRDLGEIRSCGFPVFARGLIPKPGGKHGEGILNGPVTCGGVDVEPGDWIIADEEGIVVVPAGQLDETYAAAAKRFAKDSAQSLDEWEQAHRASV
ncbi:MAG TPA: RraA family protein, partial [Xanthomonadales bacterium]|nr:RraA family protein [Xanthomonadales bacterium]